MSNFSSLIEGILTLDNINLVIENKDVSLKNISKEIKIKVKENRSL